VTFEVTGDYNTERKAKISKLPDDQSYSTFAEPFDWKTLKPDDENSLIVCNHKRAGTIFISSLMIGSMSYLSVSLLLSYKLYVSNLFNLQTGQNPSGRGWLSLIALASSAVMYWYLFNSTNYGKVLKLWGKKKLGMKLY